MCSADLEEELQLDELGVGMGLGGDGGVAAPGPQGHVVRVDIPGCGHSCFYEDGRFEATCTNPAHKSGSHFCRLTRGSLRNAGMELANGRPLGTLVTWVKAAFSSDCPTRDEHRSAFYVMGLLRPDRVAARTWLATQPNGRELLACERRRDDGEPEEPIYPPMGW